MLVTTVGGTTIALMRTRGEQDAADAMAHALESWHAQWTSGAGERLLAEVNGKHRSAMIRRLLWGSQ